VTRRTIAGWAAALAVVAAIASYLAWRRPRGCALPPRDCTERCDELVFFAPVRGLGYEVRPIDDDAVRSDATGYLRRDLMMAIQYATA
jgi:hypothetical protein